MHTFCSGLWGLLFRVTPLGLALFERASCFGNCQAELQPASSPVGGPSQSQSVTASFVYIR